MVASRLLRRWSPLFLVSSVGLFLELAVIRWLSAEVRLFSYFKNLPMLAAFLGLAIGFALVRRGSSYRSAFAPLMGIFVLLVILFSKFTSSRLLAYPSKGDEILWFTGAYSYWLALGLFLGMVLVFFVITTLLFIPLGQATGEEMALHAPTRAYIVNILASLAGVWLFALFSHLRTPPFVWFGVALLGLIIYWGGKRALSRADLAIFVLVVAAAGIFGRGIIWSPYHRLEINDIVLPRGAYGAAVKVGYNLKVQQVFYQAALDLSPGFLSKIQGEAPYLDDMAQIYNLPFQLGVEPRQVLVVGAGMGNDVAAALRHGAQRIDAVDIDPAILSLGRELHPERPYDDPRVTLITDDARAFFERNRDRYDLVVFGLLDSHTLLSGLSSVRLDSFVYTLESFRQARDHLEDIGLVALTFATAAPWIDERIGRMLVEVFGPENVFAFRGEGSISFVAGPLPLEDQVPGLVIWKEDPSMEDLPLAIDDWPYLYLRSRKIPDAYWQALLLIGAISLALIARSFPQALRPDWHFWLLGTGFLLLEFKSVTEFALLFGATWLVNAMAISGVLLMILVANLLVLWRPRFDLRWVYGLLFGTLALSFLFPLDLLVGLPPSMRAIVSMILLSLPLFFSGLIFGELLRRAGESARPLASNLSGSVAGGVLEYGSLLWGIKSLYLIAAVVYLGALLASRARRR